MYSLAVKRMILFLALLLLLLLAGCVQEGVETPGHHVHVKWLLTPIASSDGTLRSFSLQSANKNEFQWGNIELSLGPYDSENENLTIITSDDIALFKESGYFLNIKVFDDYYESTPWDIVLPVDDSFLWELTRTLERSGLTNKNDLFDEVEVDLSVSSHFC